MVKFLSAGIILQALDLKEKWETERNRLDQLQKVDTKVRRDENSSSPAQQPPHIPRPPEDLEKPMSPGFLKKVPPPSPIINDSKRARFAEADKNTSASCSFLGESFGNYEGSICTSTPVKNVKRSKATKTNQGTRRPGLSTTAESKETAMIDHDSGLGFSVNNTRISQPTVKSTKSHNTVTSESSREMNLEHSKISPSTIKKLKQFAFVERPAKKIECPTNSENPLVGQNAENPLVGQNDEKNEKGNGENTKQHSAFRVEENESLSRISTDGILPTPASNMNKTVSGENVNVNSLLRKRSIGQTIHHPNKTAGRGQLQRICGLMSNNINQRNMLQTGSTTLSMGLSKLWTLCNKAEPLNKANVSQNSIATAENKAPMHVRGNDEKTSSDAQKRKAKQTANVNSLFTLNDEDDLSDIDLEPDWGPATKKNKK